MFRKGLNVLFALSIASLGIVSALSTLPHSHGSDLDHSSHKACAVHQVAQHPLQATAAVTAVFAVFAAYTMLLPRTMYALCTTRSTNLFLRAPPAS